MSFFTWVERTALAEWVRISVPGYPMMITLHSIGLAVMVGISVVLSLRMLGLFGKLPGRSLNGFFRWAWIGFVVNMGSGVSLWAMQAVDYARNWAFLVKITGVIIGASLVAVLQRQMAGVDPARSGMPPRHAKVIAVATIIVWTAAMVTGRLVAYQ